MLRLLNYLGIVLTYISDEFNISVVHITSELRSDAFHETGFPDSWAPDYNYRGHTF